MGEGRSAKDKSRTTTEWALGERVKELTCLYGIATVDKREDLDIPGKMKAIAELLPPAWQFPELCFSRITIDGQTFLSEKFRETKYLQSAGIAVEGSMRGSVEVFYDGDPPHFDEGPFLKEERSLIQEVARQIGLIIECDESERQRQKLEEKLRRADRLAMIGQLAAGVAHELNEPLVAILGYAELMQQSFGLPDRTAMDLDRIVKASLHAREVVKKLLIFARQAPVEKTPVDLNQTIRDALLLLDTRLRKGNVETLFKSSKALPPILADAGQIQQVILNLCVNAIQAMAEGGSLTIQTGNDEKGVTLRVSDTGHGMSEDVQHSLFTPFFTTKSVGQGTGLGLSVVHGIVAGHGGTISVESKSGKGTTFEVLFPSIRPDAGGQDGG
jgi:signal transduction histidine kinase